MPTHADPTLLRLGQVRRAVRQTLVLLAGGFLLLVGLVLLVLPGPGTPVLLAGLALLATEFDWADRLLERAKAGLSRLRPSRETIVRIAATLGGCAVDHRERGRGRRAGGPDRHLNHASARRQRPVRGRAQGQGMTTTATRVRRLEPSPNLYGSHVDAIPTGSVLLPATLLAVGDVLQHARETFDLVTSIDPAGASTQLVHVLRTMPNGRTATCFFWIGEHARTTVHLVVATPSR